MMESKHPPHSREGEESSEEWLQCASVVQKNSHEVKALGKEDASKLRLTLV